MREVHVVTIGIDAHKRSLAVCLVDELGRELAAREFANEPRAHRTLHAWVLKHAPGPRRFGVESTGWVGRGIACFLLAKGEAVVDVRGTLTDRQRQRLRGQGKSDPRDALAIARVTAREEKLPPVRADSPARDLKLLCDYRQQLLGERVRVANRLHVDLVSLQPGYERSVPHLDSPPRLDEAERLLRHVTRVQAELARRRIEALRRLDAEIKQLECQIAQSVQACGSGLPRRACRAIRTMRASRAGCTAAACSGTRTRERFSIRAGPTSPARPCIASGSSLPAPNPAGRPTAAARTATARGRTPGSPRSSSARPPRSPARDTSSGE
jgi:transposase